MALTHAGRRHRRRKLKAEINVVPYIDVMLVLLIIFMVTAPLMNLGTDVRLPQSKAKALQAPTKPTVLSIYADGRYALMVDGRTNREVTAETLVSVLKGVRAANPEAVVLVNGARDANYQTIMAGIDLAREAGIDKVSLVSLPEASR